MDLRQYVEQHSREMQIWKEFKGFCVLLKYADRTAFQRRLERCKKQTYRRHQPVEEFDDALLIQYLATLIEDWRELTLGKLAGLINIEVAPADADKAVTCTEQNKIVLLERAYDFDNFVMNTVTDLCAFREEQLEAEKKTSPILPRTASA